MSTRRGDDERISSSSVLVVSTYDGGGPFQGQFRLGERKKAVGNGELGRMDALLRTWAGRASFRRPVRRWGKADQTSFE